VTTLDDGPRADGRPIAWRTPTAVGLLLVFVGVIGIHVGFNYASTDANYYATASQVIATLFIAIFLDKFTTDDPLWDDRLHRFLVMALLVASLLGVFASVRGLLGHGNGLTTGLAAAGLVSGFLLVALGLARRLRACASGSTAAAKPLTVMAVFVVVPAVVLIFLS
jgi:hypothetical protein